MSLCRFFWSTLTQYLSSTYLPVSPASSRQPHSCQLSFMSTKTQVRLILLQLTPPVFTQKGSPCLLYLQPPGDSCRRTLSCCCCEPPLNSSNLLNKTLNLTLLSLSLAGLSILHTAALEIRYFACVVKETTAGLGNYSCPQHEYIRMQEFCDGDKDEEIQTET